MSTTGERFERAVSIMERLRAPGGCPWDREQTFDSIKPYTLEETYEVLEAIDNRDWPELGGGAGRSAVAGAVLRGDGEGAGFVFDRRCARPAVCQADQSSSARVWRREGGHFGSGQAQLGSDQGRREKEEAGRAAQDEKRSILAGVSSAMPAMLEASKLSSRAAQAGFDWPNVEGLFDKLQRRDGSNCARS